MTHTNQYNSKLMKGATATVAETPVLRVKTRSIKVKFTGEDAEELYRHTLAMLRGMTKPGNSTVIYEQGDL